MTTAKAPNLWALLCPISVPNAPFFLCCQMLHDKNVGENNCRDSVSSHRVLKYIAFMKPIISYNMQSFNNNKTKKLLKCNKNEIFVFLNNGKIQTTSNA